MEVEGGRGIRVRFGSFLGYGGEYAFFLRVVGSYGGCERGWLWFDLYF